MSPDFEQSAGAPVAAPHDNACALARDAVAYALRRACEDADFRYHLLDTELFVRLCKAHAAAHGRTPEEVRDEIQAKAPSGWRARSRCADLAELAELAGSEEELRQLVQKTRGGR